MAIQKKPRRKSSARKSRWWPWLLIALFFAIAFGWWSYGDSLRGTAQAGSSYAARVACSCRFVAGRSMEDCEKDKLAGMELVRFTQDVESKSVTASVPLVASDTASYREGYGCVLKEWEG